MWPSFTGRGTRRAGGIAGSDLRRSEIFDLGKTEGEHFVPEILRIEIVYLCFAQRSNAFGADVMRGPRFRIERSRRIGVVEDHVCAIGRLAMKRRVDETAPSVK